MSKKRTYKTKAESLHLERVAALGCIVCRICVMVKRQHKSIISAQVVAQASAAVISQQSLFALPIIRRVVMASPFMLVNKHGKLNSVPKPICSHR